MGECKEIFQISNLKLGIQKWWYLCKSEKVVSHISSSHLWVNHFWGNHTFALLHAKICGMEFDPRKD